jgi:DNA-binding response OmpR family regulator
MDPLAVDSLVLIRMADEGIPLAAIARSAGIPSPVVREQLVHAKSEGRLLELPKEDWPPGFPRDQRALQLSRLTVESRAALTLVVQQLFHLTRTQVALLLALVQNPELAKPRLDMSAKTLDVHICALRKLMAPFAIRIQTLWGYGYRLSAADRHRIMDMILQQAEAS